MISSKDISVVVQGICDKNTKNLCDSIRKILPYSEIILSTWKNSDANGISYDVIIYNDDPGAISYTTNEKDLLNINRMLYSTQQGINKVSRKYILKCRNDLLLNNDNFLLYFNKFLVKNDDYSIFNHKIIVGNLFSLKFEGVGKKKDITPFHISDWYAFGISNDVREFYSVPLVNLKLYGRYFEINPRKRICYNEYYNKRMWQYPPEEYINLCNVKKKFPNILFDNFVEYDYLDITLYENYVVNNFIILDFEQSGISSQKCNYKLWSRHIELCPEHIWQGLYRYNVYESDYKKYLDNDLLLTNDVLSLRRFFLWPYFFFRKVIYFFYRFFKLIIK